MQILVGKYTSVVRNLLLWYTLITMYADENGFLFTHLYFYSLYLDIEIDLIYLLKI
jgi:hypothetical protein